MTDELPLRKEPVQVDELLERLATGFTAQARSAEVEIHVQVEPGLHLSADPVRLRQAVSNLVVNALQHTPAGGRVDLEARRTGEWVSIEVRDSGGGFGAERVDGGPGMGLGLAIVDAIVRGHGGMVEIDAAGAGGRVTMVLPGAPEGVEIDATGAPPTVGTTNLGHPGYSVLSPLYERGVFDEAYPPFHRCIRRVRRAW